MSDLAPTLRPALPASDLRKKKGRALAQIDREQKMLGSGPLGSQRLLLNIALDYMERHQGMSFDQALFAAHAYCDRVHN